MKRRVFLVTSAVLITLLSSAVGTTSGKAATPSQSADGNGSNAKPAQPGDAPTSYNLMGDAANNGAGNTTLSTSLSGGTTLTLNCANGVGCWGLNAIGNGFGVLGRATAYAGVYGETSAGGTNPGQWPAGVFGRNFSSTGVGVFGYNSNTSGSTYGVFGQVESTSGVGVRGLHNSTGGIGAGVLGETNSTALIADGVLGHVTSSSPGVTSSGVRGINDATNGNGQGVYGYHFGTGSGVYGATGGAGRGVSGFSSAGVGVYGSSNSGQGVYGTSINGVALFGDNTGNGSGFYGFSLNGPGGVMGSNATEGARFYTRNAGSYALVTGGLANTYGNVYVTGHIYATGGCCSTVQTETGTREMYAGEGTRSIFSDEGVGDLVNGRAIISIDPLFAQGANVAEDYMVFLTPRSAETVGLAVVNQTPTSFEVRELGKGAGNFKFSWRIDAVRKGHETERMEVAPPAPSAANVPDMPVVATPVPQAPGANDTK